MPSRLVELTRPGKTAAFVEATDAGLVYLIADGANGPFRVVVPFEDVKGGRFGRDEAASLLRRWVRLALDTP